MHTTAPAVLQAMGNNVLTSPLSAWIIFSSSPRPFPSIKITPSRYWNAYWKMNCMSKDKDLYCVLILWHFGDLLLSTGKMTPSLGSNGGVDSFGNDEKSPAFLGVCKPLQSCN